ncbi:MAG: ferrochelatase, partial [Candidatus Zixiibacteriota bacterium]
MDSHKPPTGILLVNLGTPDAPRTAEVRRYLRQFLSDPRVIDINPLARFLLVNLIIAPFRAAKSAAAYRQVWTDEGSPLLAHGRKLAGEVQSRLDESFPGQYVVKLAMRYGKPSTESVLREFAAQGIDRVRALPLFPQYASASVGSAVEEIYRSAGRFWNVPMIDILPVFYDNPAYINACATVATEAL